MTKLSVKQFQLKKHETTPVKVIDISSIAGKGVADGKMIPLLFLNTEDRPDIEEAIINHINVDFGDVETLWVKKLSLFSRSGLFLLVILKKPSLCNILITFDIFKHGLGIDLIVENGGFYLQSSKHGTKFIENPDAPKIMVEMISTDFVNDWNRMFHSEVAKTLRKKHKVSATKAASLATDYINEMRKINIRLK